MPVKAFDFSALQLPIVSDIMSNTTFNQQISSTGRYLHIDATRGVALFLILFSHCVQSFFVEPAYGGDSMADEAIHTACVYLVFHKSMMMFACLFGLSFYFQIKKAETLNTPHPMFQFATRLFWLGCFGMLNSLCDGHDMLLPFALCGTCLILSARMSASVIAVIAVFVLLHPFSVFLHFSGLRDPFWWRIWFFIGTPTAPDVMHSSWWEVASWNLSFPITRAMVMLYPSGRISSVIGMFLIGQCIGKSQILLPYNRKRLVRFCIALIIVFLFSCCIWKFSPAPLSTITCWWMDSVQAILFISMCALIFQSGCMLPITRALATIGRCTLTCYITQGVILGFLMYAWGLGWAGSYGITAKAFIAFIIFFVQLVFCRVWLKYHPCTPLEQLWRYLVSLSQSNKKRG